MTEDDILLGYRDGALSLEEASSLLDHLRDCAIRRPLSEGQKGLWFLERSGLATAAYNVPICFKLPQPVDLAMLESAFEFVLRQHPLLSSVIREENGVPYQRLIMPQRPGLRIEDLSGLAEDEFQSLLRLRTKLPFNLSEGPLIRIAVLGRADALYALIVVHHIVFDGACIALLLEDLLGAYAIFAANGRPAPRKLTSYADFVAWQRDFINSAVGRESLAYWKQHLEGIPPMLRLSIERNPQTIGVDSCGSQTYSVQLPAGLTHKVRELCRNIGITASVFFLGLYQIVLRRYSREQDIVIGMATMGRPKSSYDDVIGYFVDMMPVRIEVRDAEPGMDFFTRLKAVVVRNLDHAAYPFPLISREIAPATERSASPVFQVAFAYQNSGIFAGRHGSKPATAPAIELVKTLHQEGEFKLVLEVHESDASHAVHLKYDQRYFIERDIAALARHYVLLLGRVIDAPARNVGQYSMLSRSEREQILIHWNDTIGAYPAHQCLHELFEAQAWRSPQKVAIVFEKQCVTYEQLNAQANQLARFLREQGARDEQLVAICMDRSVDLIVALLGVLKAGCAYVPLDPGYPGQRLHDILEASAARIVLTQQKSLGGFESFAGHAIAVDAERSRIESYEAGDLDGRQMGLHSRQLAYVIFTSGSTGKPKGVMIEHRSIVNYVCYAARTFEVAAGSGGLLATSVSFDLTLTSLYPPLMFGRGIHICAEDRGLSSLADALLASEELAPVKLTPSHLAALHSTLSDSRIEGRVRTLVLGGEPLTAEMLEPWRRYSPQTRIFNHYGPTETTVGCIVHEVAGQSAGPVAIGRPIDNVQIYLLDDCLQPVPVGVVGEIYIAGAGVARGYLNRPDLTQERFLPNPFGTDPDARMYKSGDLGRFTADGTIEYLGRYDQQVKIRGFRIELGEIEAQLARHSSVQDAIVVARDDAPGGKRLIAYFTTSTRDAPGAEELGTHLKAHLPEYMIPSAFVRLAALPLTANGKLDRAALPAPELSAYATRQFEPPRGEVEQTLAGIWQELLAIERVGRCDNFFELGGHSLLIMQLIERLRRLGMQVDAQSVFANPTLMGLASCVRTEAKVESTLSAAGIPAGCEIILPSMLSLISLDQSQIDRIVQLVPGGATNIQDIYPLAPLQQGILFHHLLNEQWDTYINPMLLAVDSADRLQVLIEALQSAMDRHDILRTAVVWKDLPQAVQVVQRRVRLPVEEFQLQPGADVIMQLEERMSTRNLRMDLQQAPLIRLQIAREERTGRAYVLLLQHHLVTDHISLEILWSEITACLRGQQERLPAPVPYRMYVSEAVAQRERNDANAFFRSRLQDIDEPTTPYGLLDVQGDGSDVMEARQQVDADLARRIRAAARRMGVSTAALFHVAWALVVARTSGREDVVFGTVLSGRIHTTIDANRMMGMFINTLPLRVWLADVSVRDVVEHTQCELAELLKYEHASLAEAQRCSSIGGDGPLFSAVLNYRHSTVNLHTEGRRIQAESGIRMLAFRERTNYPVTVSVDDFGEAFWITTQTERRIDPQRVTEYLHVGLDSLVEALDQEPEAAVLELQILPQSELAVRRAANETTAERFECLLHSGFVAMALRNPDKIALEFPGSHMTYGELLGRSAALAEQLLARGAQTNQLIAVVMERGWEQVVAVLGILLSGAAYLPIDPQWPAQRRAYLLEQSEAMIAITQSVAHDEFEWPAHIQSIRLAHEDCFVPIYSTPPARQTSSDLAYVIFTSGSTGAPKGVVIDHKGAVNTVMHINRRFGVTADDTVLAVSELHFDLSVYDIFGVLAAGGTVVIPEAPLARDPEHWYQLIVRHGVTVWDSVPQLMNMLVDLLETKSAEDVRVPRLIMMSGDWIPVRLPDRIKRLSPATAVIGMGGATEGSIWSIYFPIDRCDPAWESIPYGKALPNQHMYVFDRRFQHCPQSVAGDIYIGGDGVALGYWRSETLTRAQFMRHPHSGERLYRTGDLGRYGSDGNIEFLGRKDQQVKIRGFRIELGEIEAQLMQHPAVKEAVVLAREDAPGDKRLVAYVTAARELVPRGNELRGHLKAALPEYMIPAAFVVLAALPLTANGKLDRKALPVPEAGAYITREYEPPEGEIEQQLAALWQEMLHVDRIGRNASFFDLGGHSILTMQMLTRLREVFGIEISLRNVFQARTLAQLGEVIFQAELAQFDAADIERAAGEIGEAVTNALPA